MPRNLCHFWHVVSWNPLWCTSPCQKTLQTHKASSESNSNLNPTNLSDIEFNGHFLFSRERLEFMSCNPLTFNGDTWCCQLLDQFTGFTCIFMQIKGVTSWHLCTKEPERKWPAKGGKWRRTVCAVVFNSSGDEGDVPRHEYDKRQHYHSTNQTLFSRVERRRALLEGAKKISPKTGLEKEWNGEKRHKKFIRTHDSRPWVSSPRLVSCGGCCYYTARSSGSISSSFFLMDCIALVLFISRPIQFQKV